MRLKTFHAATMTEVMDQVRDTLGPDALIVSVEQGKKVGGVRITAAIENQAASPVPENVTAPNPTPPQVDSDLSGIFGAEYDDVPTSKEFDTGEITAVLNHHGIPFDTGARIEEAIRAVDEVTLIDAFASGLESTLRFNPLTCNATRPIMLIGPAGAGKSICAAKLIADACMRGREVTLISTDVSKAGGISQLEHLASLMKQNVRPAKSPNELNQILDSVAGNNGLTIIDTQSINPFNMDDLEYILSYIKTVDAEPIPVIPAGLDPYDARELSEIFSQLGAQRFISTRLDAARRYGGIITAARPGCLALAAIARSPYVADGLEPATPYVLARLLTALPGTRNSSKSIKKRTA